MEKLNENDFLYHFQQAHFKENDGDKYATANLKRFQMFLAFAFSSQRHCNQTTCDLLEEHLESYIDLIDDRNGINNFAQATQDIASNIKNDCKSWKSNLLKNGPKLEELLQPLPGDCSNTLTPCFTNSTPSATEICAFEAFQEKFKHLKTEVKQNSLNKVRKTFSVEPVNSFKTRQSQSNTKQPFFKNDTKANYSNSYSKNKNTTEKCNEKANNEFPTYGSGIYFQKLGKNTVSKRKNQCENEDFIVEKAEEKPAMKVDFRTAGQQLRIENKKKFGNHNSRNMSCNNEGNSSGYHPANVFKKSLGGKRGVSTKFVPPLKSNSQEERYGGNGNSQTSEDEEVDERLKNIEPRMVELIKNEIMDCGAKVEWNDIAGLDFAKATIQEIVVWPMLRPDIFTGLRRPPKGILLFGPPGTGKTLIGKCIASQSNATFFSISASSLTSKWIGDGEKMVRALFAVARVHQPSVVFIDEIDSLLSQRSDSEHESSRRIKTEFLVQLDGAATGDEERILVIGATNRPQELDEAARRRLVKRLYIPLPDYEARKQLVTNLMKLERNTLAPEEINEISQLTDGYSGADMKNLCQEASLGPIRSIASTQMFQIKADEVRPVNIGDFKIALGRVRSSVSPEDLKQYLIWDKQYGFSTTC